MRCRSRLPLHLVRTMYRITRFPVRGMRSALYMKVLRVIGYIGEYEVTLARTECPVKLLASLGSSIEAEILLTGWYEKAESILISSILRPGMTAVDVGANIGAHALRMADSVGSNGKVFCFEPNPETYGRLLANIKRNGFTQAAAFNIALGRECGRMPLYVNYPWEPNRNANMVIPHSNRVIVNVISLDNAWYDLMDRAKVDLIKMDIEGYEYPVLLGADGLIGSCHPVILSEFAPQYCNLLGYGWDDIKKWYESREYKIHVINRRNDGSIYNFVAKPGKCR